MVRLIGWNWHSGYSNRRSAQGTYFSDLTLYLSRSQEPKQGNRPYITMIVAVYDSAWLWSSLWSSWLSSWSPYTCSTDYPSRVQSPKTRRLLASYWCRRSCFHWCSQYSRGLKDTSFWPRLLGNPNLSLLMHQCNMIDLHLDKLAD